MDNQLNESLGADVTVSESTKSHHLPEWLTGTDIDISPIPKPIVTPERKALMFQQFDMVFPRMLELMASGYTLTKALLELPIEIDSGAFLRWIKKDPGRSESYRDAKEIRTEFWAGKLVDYAEGENSAEDVQRSKLKVDTLKWLMAADNRRTYGEVKQVDIGGSISITAALAQAQARVLDAIDVTDTLTDTSRLENGDD